MRALSAQGDLVGSYDTALKEHRTVCFLAFDGYMCKAVKRALERPARAVQGQGGRPFRASESGGASTPGRAAGAALVKERRQRMAVGRWPSAARRSTRAQAEAGTRIRELPEEHEVLRRGRSTAWPGRAASAPCAALTEK